MGSCCAKEAHIDKRSARSTFFDAKKKEKEAREYTLSQFKKHSRIPAKSEDPRNGSKRKCFVSGEKEN